jgi:hypothetical protein
MKSPLRMIMPSGVAEAAAVGIDAVACVAADCVVTGCGGAAGVAAVDVVAVLAAVAGAVLTPVGVSVAPELAARRGPTITMKAIRIKIAAGLSARTSAALSPRRMAARFSFNQ